MRHRLSGFLAVLMFCGLALCARADEAPATRVEVGVYGVGGVRLTVEADVRRVGGRDLAERARVLDASGAPLHEERYDPPPGAALRPFPWSVSGLDLLALDAEVFATPRGGERRFAFLLWESDFCPVGKKKKAVVAAPPPTGRLSVAARLRIADGTLVERPADAPGELLRGDRVTAAALDPNRLLLLKVPLRFRPCAPEGERFTLVAERDGATGLPLIEAVPFVLDPALRGPAVLLYDAPSGKGGRLVPLSSATALSLGRAHLAGEPLEARGNDYAVAPRVARVEAVLDGVRGYVEASDLVLLGLIATP